MPRFALRWQPKHWLSASVLTPALVCGAIALVASGQALAGRSVPRALDWLTFLSGFIDSIFVHADSVAAASVLLVGGAALFAFTAGKASEASGLTLPRPAWGFWPSSLRRRDSYIAVALAAAGLALVAYTVVRLATAEYHHRYAFIFLAGLVLVIFALLLLDREIRSIRIRLSWPLVAEVAFVAIVISVFVALNVRDLTSWKYSANGDEFDGYGYAKRLAGGDIPNVFSQRGVEQTRPVLGSVVDAAFLKAFGGDLFAWKLRLVVLAAASFVPFYLLTRELFSWRVAVPALAFFASSHYLFAYTHHPTFIDALLPTTLSLWLLVLGLRRNSLLALFCSGIAAGLGFYTFYAGRAIMVVILLYLLSFGPRFFKPKIIVPLILGFGLMVAPMFASDGWYVIHRMIDQSAAGYSGAVVGSRTTRFLHNVALTAVAFNYNEAVRHYVSGSLLDPVTAVLYVLGIGLVVAQIRHAAFRLVLIWWLVALAATGFTSPYPQVAISRLHYVIPAAALLAALAFDRVLRLANNVTRAPPLRALVPCVALAALAVPVLYLNLHRFWYETPTKYGAPTEEAVAVRAFFSDECRGGRRGVTIITDEPNSLLRYVFGSYRLGDRSPRLLNYPTALQELNAKNAGAATTKNGCIAIASTGRVAGMPQPVIDRVKEVFPQKRLKTVTDLSGGHPVQLFY